MVGCVSRLELYLRLPKSINLSVHAARQPSGRRGANGRKPGLDPSKRTALSKPRGNTFNQTLKYTWTLNERKPRGGSTQQQILWYSWNRNENLNNID